MNIGRNFGGDGLQPGGKKECHGGGFGGGGGCFKRFNFEFWSKFNVFSKNSSITVINDKFMSKLPNDGPGEGGGCFGRLVGDKF